MALENGCTVPHTKTPLSLRPPTCYHPRLTHSGVSATMSRPLTRADHIHVGQIYRSTQDTVYRLCLIAAIKQHPIHKTDRGEPLIVYDCLKLTITEAKTFKLTPASYSRSELIREFPYLSYSCAYPSHVFTANYERRNKLTKVYKWEDKPVRYSQLSIFANEFVNLLNSGGNPIGMIDLFTDVWDQEVFRVETKIATPRLTTCSVVHILDIVTFT